MACGQVGGGARNTRIWRLRVAGLGGTRLRQIGGYLRAAACQRKFPSVIGSEGALSPVGATAYFICLDAGLARACASPKAG